MAGVSGGGPYVAVCAYKIPERITRAGIIAGLAPTDIPGILDGISWINKFSWASFHRFPDLTQISAFLGWLETNILPTNLSSYFLVSKPDKVMSNAPFRKAVHLNRKEAFRQGIKGPTLDLKLYSRTWGFELKEIKTPVHLWYGDADKTVSLNMGKYYLSKIKGSELIVYPNEGHYCLQTHAREILKILIN